MGDYATSKEMYDVLTSNVSNSDIKTAMIISDIALAILNERVKRNMTQKEFAKFLGISQGMVSKWESGDYNFTIASINRVFEKLGLNFECKIAPTNGISEIDTDFEDDVNISFTMQKHKKFKDGSLHLINWAS